MRVVCDTSIIVSHFLHLGSTPSQALVLARRQAVVLISQATFDELAAVLRRPKFAPYVQEEDIAQMMCDLSEEAELISDLPTIRICRDPNDDKFLELAVGGEADYIVTGDSDLLILDPFHGIRILTPRAFIDIVEI